jgi:hypothetical protein
MPRALRIASVAAATMLALAACHSGSGSRPEPAAAGGAVRSETTPSSSAPSSSTTTAAPSPTTGTTTATHRVDYAAPGGGIPADCPPPFPLGTDDTPVRGRTLTMASPQKGFAVDDTAVVVTDDGRTWSRRWSGSDPMFSVEAVDADHAWAVGQHVLVRTTNGGRTWDTVGEPDDGMLRVVDFVDSQTGWGVTDTHVYRTVDGGHTWRRTDPPCGGEAVCFSGGGSGWAAVGPFVYRTADGGDSWTAAFTVPTDAIDRPFSLQSVHAAQLDCAQPGTVWALFTGRASGSHTGYVAYRGTAGGPWTPVLKEPVAGPQAVRAPAAGTHPAPMASLGPDSALFVSFSPLARPPDSLALRLATGGGTHLGPPQAVPGLFSATSISFLSPDVGWVIGAKTGPATVDAILATTDGGRTWQEQYAAPLPAPTG